MKTVGNMHYKAKRFYESLTYFDKAIEKCPEEPIFYTNKAASYFEIEKFEECVKVCDKAIELSKNDNAKLAKAMYRKGKAL